RGRRVHHGDGSERLEGVTERPTRRSLGAVFVRRVSGGGADLGGGDGFGDAIRGAGELGVQSGHLGGAASGGRLVTPGQGTVATVDQLGQLQLEAQRVVRQPRVD